MKKTLLALAVLAVSGAAFASGAAVGAHSVTSTFASAGNGGTSTSNAGNFAIGSGFTGAATHPGILPVVVPNCTKPTTATLIGHITTVNGTASTTGGSFASNVSTGGGSGSANAYGISTANVAKTSNGVSGSAGAVTQTWAAASSNQANSSFASQNASFVAKGGTGHIVLTQDKTVRTPFVVVGGGVGALSTSHSIVPKSYQVVGAVGSTNQCGVSVCPQNVGNPFNGTQLVPNSATGSNTFGQASTVTNVSIGNLN